MINQYYTPTIEEMYVGYECEVYDQATRKLVKDVRWHKILIGVGNEIGEKLSFGRVKKFIRNLHIRTLYLTKEQIEAEGWFHTSGQVFPEGRQGFEKNVGVRGYCDLHYEPLNHKLRITQRNPIRDRPGMYSLLTIYAGYSPSINEFRTICKLLKIQ